MFSAPQIPGWQLTRCQPHWWGVARLPHPPPPWAAAGQHPSGQGAPEQTVLRGEAGQAAAAAAAARGPGRR